MTTNPKGDIDSRTLHILDKIQEEYEVIKRQGFPSHIGGDAYFRAWDATIPSDRWHSWAKELGIDYIQLNAILKIIENEGLLEKFSFIDENR